MPQIINKGKVISNNGAGMDDIEIFRNITYMTKYYGMSYKELMELPYTVFCVYMKWARIFELEQTEEGRKALKQSEIINRTDADLTRFRQLAKQGVD